jgi:hypothetical protein
MLRNGYVSGCNRAEVAVFRHDCLEALALIPEDDRPDVDAAIVRSGASEQRMALRTSLEEAGNAPGDGLAAVVGAIRTIEDDLDSGAHVAAGHLLARVLPVVARAGDPALISQCAGLVRVIRERATDAEQEVFLSRCKALLSTMPKGTDIEEMLAMFQVTNVVLVQARLNRLVSTGTESVPEELATTAIDTARRRLDRGLSSASFIIEPLLILAVSVNDAQLIDVTCELTRELLPIMPPGVREMFTRTIYQTLGSSWTEYSRCRAILKQIPLTAPIDAVVSVMDRQLRAGGVAPPDMMLELLSEIDAHIRGRRYTIAGIFMQRLLPLSASANGGTISVAVSRLATMLIEAMPPQTRSDFARNTYQAIAEGTWGDMRTGERELHRLGITSTADNQIADLRLRELIADPARAVDSETLRSGLDVSVKRINDGRIAAVGYLLGPLLPLASRLGDAAFEQELHDLVTARYLPSATQRARDGFRGSLHRLLDKKAWPSAAEGELLLAKLGISPRHTKRLLESDGPVSTADATIAIETVMKMLDRRHASDAASAIAPMLGAAVRCGDERVRHQAMQMLQRFLDSPETQNENLDRVTKECRDMVASGMWGSPEAAETAVEEMAIAPVRLESLASTPRLPISRDVLASGIRVTEAILTGSWPRRANDYIANLLPLTERIGDAALASAVDDTVQEMLRRHPSMQSLLRRRCERMLTAWPDAEAAAVRLKRLGIVTG